MTTELCSFLPWDSEFFGARIARLNPSRMDPVLMAEAIEWCNIEAIDCLYVLVDPSSTETVRLAEKNRFMLMDIRMELCMNNAARISSARKRPPASLEIGRAEPGRELGHLKKIAANCHGGTRFYADPGFRNKAPGLYERWIEVCCDRESESVLVARLHGDVVGYITFSLQADDSTGTIGLFAIDVAARRKGIGTLLLDKAITELIVQGAEDICVVTQGANSAAVGLYCKCGFHPIASLLWYHRWSDKDVREPKQ